MNGEINPEKERERDTQRILGSSSTKRVVVAGPGTGKSFLFQEAIKVKKAQGGNNFLAITFMGKLCDELADDLAGLAQARTLHGFAREYFLRYMQQDHKQPWRYYPKMKDIIEHDLKLRSIAKTGIEDEEYIKRSKYYQAVGHDDVVYYVTRIFEEDPDKIPNYDLILVDEFQDFNKIEAKLIDQLASRNEILIVGDDDQALYEFKGSSPKFIREKYNNPDNNFENYTLRYCSRCPQVIIDAFRRVIDCHTSNRMLENRIDKDYLYYPPGKKEDSWLNHKILLLSNIPPSAIAYKIKEELQKISENQKVQSVLIIGEGRTCKTILDDTARLLKEYGFQNVERNKLKEKLFSFDERYLEGYKALSEDGRSVFAWRLLIEKLDDGAKRNVILNGYDDKTKFIDTIPDDFKTTHIQIAKSVNRILTNSKSKRDAIADSTIDKLKKEIVTDQAEEKETFLNQLIYHAKRIPGPLSHTEITVSSILGAKGLGADIVFLVGFDQGRLPSKGKIERSEVYQFLVALTRAKKRIYLVNTKGSPTSIFVDDIKNYIQEIN